MKIDIEVEFGPTLRTALDVLDLMVELMELVPEWHSAERDELENRASGLLDRITTKLQIKKTRQSNEYR